jgi:Caspase domain
VRRAWLAALWLLAARPAAGAVDGHRFALVAGEPEGGPGTARLHHAERDARRIHAILTRVGGVSPDDATLLLSGGLSAFRRAFAELSARAAAVRGRGEPTVLIVYFSGHAMDGALRFGGSGLPLADLRAALQAAPADVRIGLVDACRSGAIARTKGVRPAPDFTVSGPAEGGPRGLVLIASSAADEASQESDDLGASYFTHHLASGLLGDADASGDGRVTLSEAYAYVYERTVGATAGSAAGVQHPVFLYDLGGAGDVVLTDLGAARGAIVFPAPLEGRYVVLDGGGRAVAEVDKPGGVPRRLSLVPGRYTVKKRLEGDEGLLVGSSAASASSTPPPATGSSRRPRSREPSSPCATISATDLPGASMSRPGAGRGACTCPGSTPSASASPRWPAAHRWPGRSGSGRSPCRPEAGWASSGWRDASRGATSCPGSTSSRSRRASPGPPPGASPRGCPHWPGSA